MKWLEVIELRTAVAHQEQLESLLKKLMREVSEKVKKQEITAYCRFMIDNNFCIHLNHDTMEVESNGSPLGLCIASHLKEYGLVNHSVWVERNI